MQFGSSMRGCAMSHQWKGNSLPHTWTPNSASWEAAVDTCHWPFGQAHSLSRDFSSLPELPGGAYPKNAMTARSHNLARISAPNPAHALDGGIPSWFHIARRWPAASDVQC